MLEAERRASGDVKRLRSQLKAERSQHDVDTRATNRRLDGLKERLRLGQLQAAIDTRWACRQAALARQAAGAIRRWGRRGPGLGCGASTQAPLLAAAKAQHRAQHRPLSRPPLLVRAPARGQAGRLRPARRPPPRRPAPAAACCSPRRHLGRGLKAGGHHERRLQRQGLEGLEAQLARLQEQLRLERQSHAAASEFLQQQCERLASQAAGWGERVGRDGEERERELQVGGGRGRAGPGWAGRCQPLGPVLCRAVLWSAQPAPRGRGRSCAAWPRPAGSPCSAARLPSPPPRAAQDVRLQHQRDAARLEEMQRQLAAEQGSKAERDGAASEALQAQEQAAQDLVARHRAAMRIQAAWRGYKVRSAGGGRKKGGKAAKGGGKKKKKK
jgi:hypothetical protein